MSPIGIINEVGDLGLGFDPLNDKDQKVLKENQEKEEKKDEKKKGWVESQCYARS